MSERKTSPISYSDSVLEPEQSYGAKKEEEERLLIDLRSPGQEEGPWSEIRIGGSKSVCTNLSFLCYSGY